MFLKFLLLIATLASPADVCYGSNIARKLAHLFLDEPTVDKLKVNKVRSFDRALQIYSQKQFLSKSLTEITTYRQGESFLINAPYLITKVPLWVLAHEMNIHIKERAFAKHWSKKTYDKNRHLLNRLLAVIKSEKYKIAFDGTAETKCESPSHRVILYKINHKYIYAFNIDDC